MTTLMLPRDIQLTNEYMYSRKFVDGYIEQEIRDNPQMEAKVTQGVVLLTDWLALDHGYDSKNNRLAQLADIEIEPLVRSLFVGVAYCQASTLFTSVSAQLASRLKFDDKADSILTVAEMLAVLCETDAFDITKANKNASMYVIAHIPISQKLVRYVDQAGYLPPMMCEPEELVNNYDSGYLTHNDSLVLGSGNGHAGDLCLDVLNKRNKVPMRLCTEFLSKVEEMPTFELDTAEKVQQWAQHKTESYQRYSMVANQGNRFWLTNKPDMRGRLYTQGYHINIQGTAFKKAMIEFADEELVEGVPT
jgi:hypothetical protein